MATWLWLGFIAAVPFLAWLLRRWTRQFDDYYEREYQDPPIFDATGFLGGSRGWH